MAGLMRQLIVIAERTENHHILSDCATANGEAISREPLGDKSCTYKCGVIKNLFSEPNKNPALKCACISAIIHDGVHKTTNRKKKVVY